MLPITERADLPVRTSRLPRSLVRDFSSKRPLTFVCTIQDSDVAILHSRIPFIRTGLISTASPSSPALPIIALDCELVYTTSGMALARLTVIDHNSVVVLDEHVRPQGTVLDLNTRFSGVKEEDVASSVLDAKGVRDKLGELIDEDTIMVGHGLENDLKAMRIVHHRVIDTAIVSALRSPSDL